MVFLIAATTTSCNGKKGDNSARHNSDYFDYEGNFHEDIIVPQVKAWKEVAKVMYPNVCDDTETEWAWTWSKLCGKEGELVICLECRSQYFYCTGCN